LKNRAAQSHLSMRRRGMLAGDAGSSLRTVIDSPRIAVMVLPDRLRPADTVD
jgi:hypothetical protein